MCGYGARCASHQWTRSPPPFVPHRRGTVCAGCSSQPTRATRPSYASCAPSSRSSGGSLPPACARAPELVPSVELLLCARAAAFVGTWPSTFSATVVAQRDARLLPRNTTHFFGFPPDEAPWDIGHAARREPRRPDEATPPPQQQQQPQQQHQQHAPAAAAAAAARKPPAASTPAAHTLSAGETPACHGLGVGVEVGVGHGLSSCTAVLALQLSAGRVVRPAGSLG